MKEKGKINERVGKDRWRRRIGLKKAKAGRDKRKRGVGQKREKDKRNRRQGWNK